MDLLVLVSSIIHMEACILLHASLRLTVYSHCQLAVILPPPHLLTFVYVDINECGSGDVCPQDSTCVNTDGSFTCNCNDGFVMNGALCEGEI